MYRTNKNTKKQLRASRLANKCIESLERRVMLDAVPVVSIDIEPQQMIGETVNFSVQFDNQATIGATVGFAPYVDLFLDTTGADGVAPGGSEPTDFDGFGSVSASVLGASLIPIEVTIGAGGSYEHPIAVDNAGDPLTATAPAGFEEGDTLYVIELPFGSFTDTQTPLDVEITTSLSDQADVGVPLSVAAQGGFRLGHDALDNPTIDSSIVGATASTTTNPTLIRLFKEYLGSESETATGPNYPQQYRIRADIADGQTISDLRLIDLLPDNLAFFSVVSSTPTATIEETPTVGSADVSPSNDLVAHFASITGTTSDDDANIMLEFFVPDVDAGSNDVLDPTTGDDLISTNDAQATGDWTPTDPSDAAVAISIVDAGDDNFDLEARSIAIQKSASIVTDAGVAGPSQGDVVEYTLRFQISDFFTFGDIVIEDILSDGLRLDGSPGGPFTGPFTFDVTDRDGNVTGSFTPSTIGGTTDLHVDETQIGNDANPATDGSTRLVFDISQAIIDAGAADGILQGGRAITPDAAAATGTITYQAIIQQQFSDTFPSGDSTVNEGDTLDNTATVSGTIRSNSSITTILDSESDTSSATLDIQTGSLLKTTYAVNGVLGTDDAKIDPDTGLAFGPSYSNSVEVRPGDVVTYRLRYVLPTGDVEDFLITDFLQSPVFDASVFSTTFDATIDAAAPAAESAKFGPDHTFSRIPITAAPSVTPTISTDAIENTVDFDFGSFDNPPPESETVIDVLLSVTISSEPTADGVFLTNMATTTHGTTNAGTNVVSEITQLTLTEPDLQIRKGFVSTNNPNAVFSGTIAPTGITFEDPGIVSATSFSGGTINSTNLDTTFDAALDLVDAADLVKFAIVIENTGTSSAGAFDIQLRDDLPFGFVIPAAGPGLNLEVFDGTGAAIPFTTIGTGLFDPVGGIELTDPGATAESGPPAVDGGALDEFDPTDGQNIAIITFDLEVDGAVEAGLSIENTATLFNYAGQEGGSDHTAPSDRTATAAVDIAMPVMTKTIVDTSINNTANSDTEAVVGELITYELVIEVLEGTVPSAVITDTLDSGLAFVDVVSVDTGTLVVANTIDTGTAPTNTTITNSGGTIDFDFGDIDNSDIDNATTETITIQYRVVVLNLAANESGTDVANSAVLAWTGGSAPAASAPTVSVIEPDLVVTNAASPEDLHIGDTVTFTVTIAHSTNSTDAHEVTLSDIVPAGLTYVGGSWANTAGLAPDSTSEAGPLTATWASFPDGSTSTFTF
ncbi:MAG: isopeptide-forming domain-containing fimbrial protein, partial [Planctomycetales bacterium]|nr:isopeptide-forming domain-containing fimbrial protein [Planctomycetales bacterium]